MRKLPAIPAQRALLSWKDGVETLVIASALDSEAEKLGWIIPVPAVPEIIEKQTPGGLKTLNLAIQPDIVHDLWLETQATIVLVVLANLILATALFRPERLPFLLCVLAILFVFFGLFVPALGRAGSGGTSRLGKATVEKSVRVGSYDVNILRPSQLGDLNAWLDENGFTSLPSSAAETVADYAAKGWVFAAIRLTRSEAGANVPHPIKMVFRCSEAVYPMRLTAMAGASPDLELFVVADQRAACNLLLTEFCDRFVSRDNSDLGYRQNGTHLSGVYIGRYIAHEGITNLMWDNCVLTKLAGKVSPAGMSQDIRLKWKPFTPHLMRLFTARGARSLCLMLFVGIAGVWLFGSMVACCKRIKGPLGLRWYWGKVLLPAVVLVATGVGTVYALLPKVDAAEVQPARWWYRDGLHLRADIGDLLKKDPDLLSKSEEIIANTVLNTLRDSIKGWRGAVDEVQIEDSPGNFTVEKRDGKTVIRLHSLRGDLIMDGKDRW